jgi:hypothetical protein
VRVGWTGPGWATPCGGRESVGETDQTARKTSLQIQTGGFPSSIHNRPPDGTKYPPITAHMRYLPSGDGPPILNLVCQGACGSVGRTGWGHTVWWAGSY